MTRTWGLRETPRVDRQAGGEIGDEPAPTAPRARPNSTRDTERRVNARSVALTDAPGSGAHPAGRFRSWSPGSPGALAHTASDAVPPPALVLLGIVSVQVGAGIAKQLFGQLPPSGVVTLRIVFAAVAVMIIARPRLRGAAPAHLGVATAFGLAMAVMNFSIYQSFARIPLGIAVTIEFLGPLGVAVAGSRRKLDLFWVVLAAAGVAGLSGGGGSVTLAGVGFALLAGAAWAAYILLAAATGQRFPGSSGLALAMVAASALILPVGASTAGTELLQPRLLLLGAAVAMLSSVVPYTLELEALRRMPPKLFGILLSLEPAVAALVGLLLLGEVLGAIEWLAICSVVIASAGATRTQSGRPPEA